MQEVDSGEQMHVARHNEEPRTWYRAERVYMSGSEEWFFQTREGVDVGPYSSRFEAEVEAGLLKELLREQSDRESVMTVIREFVLDAYAMGQALQPQFRDTADILPFVQRTAAR